MPDLGFSFSARDSGVSDIIAGRIAHDVRAYQTRLRNILSTGMYDTPEGSLCLPGDSELRERVLKVARKLHTDQLQYIVVVGIGGSNLGTKAIYETMVGGYDELIDERKPKLLFLDTLNPFAFRNITTLFDAEVTDKAQIAVVMISKSGTTTEVIGNVNTLHAYLSGRFGNVFDRYAMITTKGNTLWNIGEKQGVQLLDIPKVVGGRYSVFSAVGLLPLALVGFDIGALHKGAERALKAGVHDNEENPALVSAAALYTHWQHGITIHNSFFFIPRLESVGKWYRQLMGESIGKRENTEGKEVHIGITPIVSIGSTDLHSVAQLYFGGPKDKFTTLVIQKSAQHPLCIPPDPDFDTVEGTRGKSYGQVMSAIYGGVKKAYQHNDLPFVECSFDRIDEESIGAFLQTKMLEIMYLAHLLGVNAFDQPSVEDYKSATRKLL